MNPEAEARRNLVGRLRAAAAEFDSGTFNTVAGISMRQAANEIEYLAACKEEATERFFDRLGHDLKKCMQQFFWRELGHETWSSMSVRDEGSNSFTFEFQSPTKVIKLQVEVTDGKKD